MYAKCNKFIYKLLLSRRRGGVPLDAGGDVARECGGSDQLSGRLKWILAHFNIQRMQCKHEVTKEHLCLAIVGTQKQQFHSSVAIKSKNLKIIDTS